MPLTRQELRVWILEALTAGGNVNGTIFNIAREGGSLDEKSRRLHNRPLTDDERIDAAFAYRDLLWGEYVADYLKVTDRSWITITPKGRAYLESQGTLPFHAIALGEVVSDSLLLSRCEPTYLNRDYDVAVLTAFKIVEERLRAKAGLGPDAFGVDLVNRALAPASGVLADPNAQTAAEHEGIHRLFLGAVATFKNPSSHRTVGYDTEATALKAIAFADLLLGVVARLQRRNPQSAS